MENKKNYYAIIPANVRYSKNLKANEKLMYGELTALANDKGFCYASNEYFAKLYDVSKVSVSKWVSNLAKNDFIRLKMIYLPKSKQIKERRIYITPPTKKSLIPIKEKLNTPHKEKLKDIYISSINNNIKDNNTTKSKTPIFNELSIKAFPHFVALFPLSYKPKTKAQENNWLDCLDKLQRIDKYNLRDVYNVAKELRDDEFWQKNFLSILKFRNTDKNGIKYIDRFMTSYKSKQKPIGYNKIKGLIEYYIYTSPANGEKELGAKTKSGKLFEFHLKQNLQTKEFQELKEYIKNGNK
jgi:hypothetical protein